LLKITERHGADGQGSPCVGGCIFGICTDWGSRNPVTQSHRALTCSSECAGGGERGGGRRFLPVMAAGKLPASVEISQCTKKPPNRWGGLAHRGGCFSVRGESGAEWVGLLPEIQTRALDGQPRSVRGLGWVDNIISTTYANRRRAPKIPDIQMGCHDIASFRLNPENGLRKIDAIRLGAAKH
jgi:hypothetical protein